MQASQEEINSLINEIDPQETTYNGKPNGLASYVAAPVSATFNMCYMAQQLLVHLTDPTATRIARFAGKMFWPALLSLSIAMKQGEVTPFGYAVNPDRNSVGLWFSYMDTVYSNSVRHVFLILKAQNPTLMMVGEDIAYASTVSQNAAQLLQKFATDTKNYLSNTGSSPGVIFLTREAYNLIKGELFTHWKEMSLGRLGGFNEELSSFGNCLKDEIQKNPQYKEWQARQNAKPTNGSEKISEISMTKEDAYAAAEILLAVGITATIVIIAVGSQQYYVLAVIPAAIP